MRVLPSGTLFQTPDLDNFASAYRSSKSLIDLARQGRRSERDQLDHRRSTKFDNTSGLRRSTAVVYHSDRRALSAARFRRVVLLATADTCSNVNTVSRAQDGIILKVTRQRAARGRRPRCERGPILLLWSLSKVLLESDNIFSWLLRHSRKPLVDDVFLLIKVVKS